MSQHPQHQTLGAGGEEGQAPSFGLLRSQSLFLLPQIPSSQPLSL